jgi:hypothetical protein
MKLLNLIVKMYERWQDRRRFGKLEPLDHYCVHRVMENGDKISYMMKYDPRTTKRGQQSTNKRPPQLYATRVVGREVWKAEALLTEAGDSIGYVQRRRRVSLGLAMGTVKDDDSVIEWE